MKTTYLELDCLHCDTPTRLDLGRETVLCEYCGAVYTVKQTEKEIQFYLQGTYGYPTKQKPEKKEQ